MMLLPYFVVSKLRETTFSELKNISYTHIYNQDKLYLLDSQAVS